jgi:CRISPR-associated protein Csm5
MMRYRVTCLTPTLVGDGRRLAPIDYMVWKDHVNVLDQNRIFRLLAKGSRLESYLAQLKKAEKLDFASWGGFAQNFAGRRIPFEHAGSAQYWDRERAENLFIPTFASGIRGAYLPATSIKGALRTGALFGRAGDHALTAAAERAASEGRPPRRPAEAVERAVLGGGGGDRMRLVSAADSEPAPETAFRIYLLRVSTLDARGPGRYELAWKQTPRGTVRRAEDSTPLFAEMATPGTTFEGAWTQAAGHGQRREPLDVRGLFAAANAYAAELLKIQRRYSEWTGLNVLAHTIDQLEERLRELEARPEACLLPLGWGAGFLSKSSFLNTEDGSLRQILKQVPFYSRAIESGLPFPKTRKVVFLDNQPASLPGFVALEVIS